MRLLPRLVSVGDRRGVVLVVLEELLRPEEEADELGQAVGRLVLQPREREHVNLIQKDT